MTFTEAQLTITRADPRMGKIKYVFQGANLLPEVVELNFKTMMAKTKFGQQACFTEVRDPVGQRLRLVDLFYPAIEQAPESFLSSEAERVASTATETRVQAPKEAPEPPAGT